MSACRPIVDGKGNVYKTTAEAAEKLGFSTTTIYCRARDQVMGLRFATRKEALAVFSNIDFKEPKAPKKNKTSKCVADSRVSKEAVYVQVGKHVHIPVVYKGRFYSSTNDLGRELGTASKNIARRVRRAIKNGVGDDMRFATADEIRANLPGSMIRSAWPRKSKKIAPPPAMDMQKEIIRSQGIFQAFTWPKGQITILALGPELWSKSYANISEVPADLLAACKPEFV